jgi:hypothetical protein
MKISRNPQQNDVPVEGLTVNRLVRHRFAIRTLQIQLPGYMTANEAFTQVESPVRLLSCISARNSGIQKISCSSPMAKSQRMPHVCAPSTFEYSNHQRIVAM